MSTSSLIGMSWFSGLNAVLLLTALAGALIASLIQTGRLRKSNRAVQAELARSVQRLASAQAELLDARARTLQWKDSMREYLAHKRHGLLGDMNVTSGFLLILRPQIEDRVSVQQLDYFDRALGGLNRAIAAADGLRDGAPDGAEPPQLLDLTASEPSPADVKPLRRLEVGL